MPSAKHLTAVAMGVCLWSFMGSLGLAQEFKQRTVTLDGSEFSVEVFTTPDAKEYGYFVPGSRWPKQPNDTTIIFVCWQDYKPEFREEYDLIQQGVKASWQDHSKIEFRG